MQRWSTDPYSMGAYSYAVPGGYGARDKLAALTDDKKRIFFAGEATWQKAYATAHGAYLSGQAAARRACVAYGIAIPEGGR